MAQLTHNNKNYNIYIDISKNHEFVMEAEEVERFQKLVGDNNNRVEDIPDEELLTGTYLNQNTRLPEGRQCEEIVANKVRFTQ